MYWEISLNKGGECLITKEELHYPKLKDIAHLLSIYDEFDVTLDGTEVGMFNYKALIDNHREAYVTYISFGAEDYGDIIFMCIDLFDKEHKEGLLA